jgi:Sulfotransferase family
MAIPDEDSPTVAEYRYPDFLCIGVQRSGTTWLDKNLRRHPGLWLPPVKEIQYFNHLYLPQGRDWTARMRQERATQTLRRYLNKTPQTEWDYRHVSVLGDIATSPVSDRWYGRIFSLAPPDEICGEVAPDYAGLPDEGIRHVLRLSPQLRVILSLRDPIERAWSHIRITVADGTDLAALKRAALNTDVFARSDYPAIVARWRGFIPEDRFRVIFMDDIVAKPASVLEEVCGFLGVTPNERLSRRAAEIVHAGRGQEMPPSVLERLKQCFRPVYEGISALYPEMGRRWMERHYRA